MIRKRAQVDLKIVASVVLAMTVAACGSGNGLPPAITSAVAKTNTTALKRADSQTTGTDIPAASLNLDQLVFTASSFSAQQGVGSAAVTVARRGMNQHSLTVNYFTADQTAVSGVDYTQTAGVLTWSENDDTVKTINIPISNLTPLQVTEAFAVILSNPNDAAAIANPGAARVVISSDAISSIGTMQFDAGVYDTSQGSGSMPISVTRTGGSSGSTSVTYTSVDGTAVAGTDYSSASGTLTWADGDTAAKTFAVAINNAIPFLGSKNFTVTLADAASGVALGSAAVTIEGNSNPARGTVKLAQSSATVTQAAGTASLTVERSGGSYGAIVVQYAAYNGTALAGVDFSPIGGTLTWADGDATSRQLSIPILNGTPFSGNKRMSLYLTRPSEAGTIASPGAASITIEGDASPAVGVLQLDASSYTVAQDAGTLTVTVDRVSGSSGAISVACIAIDGSAVAGTDYDTAPVLLNWADGDASPKSFSVAVGKAMPFSGIRSFTLKLLGASGGTSLSLPRSAIVNITGDVAAGTSAAGTLQISTASTTVAQSAGTVTVTVNRTGGSSGAASVQYATAGGSAVPGTDFTVSGGTLNWASGDESSKTFPLVISNATPFSGTKSFTVGLSSASGATMSSLSSEFISITGRGAAVASGSLQLSSANYTVAQSAGSLLVTVNRSGVLQGAAGAAAVSYATADGTAVAGTDYTTASGTLTWASGDTTPKTFNLPISNATPFSGSKTFALALFNPTGGSTLSTPSSASISIIGSGTASPPTGSGGPTAVNSLQLINQGGTGNNTNNGSVNSLSNFQQISWTPATPGANAIASYNIYRNGSLYANVPSSSTNYADTAATNSNSPDWSAPASVYVYNVAAVDSTGKIGPQAKQMTMYGYQNGYSNWSNTDLSYSGVVGNENYASTAGNPQGGPFDVSIFFPNGGWQPTTNAPQVPEWDLELGAFNYFTIDINPGATVSSYVQLNMLSRLPPGDVGTWSNGINIFNYGPAPVANTWATYKVPLSVLNFGVSSFTGSISGTTLNVTSVQSGGVDAGGYVTGPNVPAGTYITGYGQAASVGTFTVAGPGISATTSVPSTAMTYQRTSLYKFNIQPNTNPVTMYFNNYGLTVN